MQLLLIEDVRQPVPAYLCCCQGHGKCRVGIAVEQQDVQTKYFMGNLSQLAGDRRTLNEVWMRADS